MIMPELSKDAQMMKQNLDFWKTYEENEEDKRVYERNNMKVVSIQVSSVND